MNNNNNFNNNDNVNDNENNHESSGYLLFSNENGNNIFNNSNNHNNPSKSIYINSTNENTYINYNNLDSLSNIFPNNNDIRRYDRVIESYVYISATGKKYHGRPQCGRMKSSRRVTLTNAKAMGLEPCLKCY